MLRIAVVEDDRRDRMSVVECLRRFEREEKEEIEIEEFGNGVDFLEERRMDLDIVFMDIQMPCMDGMDTAQEFRLQNTETVLIFITNMAQYAMKGYGVNALDYILKPLNYHGFALKMKRAVREVQSGKGQQLLIRHKAGLAKVAFREIRYVEVLGHKIKYHLKDREIETYGSMRSVMGQIDDSSFFLCNSCYYVNLYYVTGVEGFEVYLGNTRLQISHPKKKSFLKALNDYVGGRCL